MTNEKIPSRKVKILAAHISALIAPPVPARFQVLDVGCGDGLIDKLIMDSGNNVSITGCDVLVRSKTHIPVQEFDGRHLPYADNSFDGVLFSDVLHHTLNPFELLKEAARVSRQYIFIKDHLLEGPLAFHRLKFMDWVGNSRFGVSLPYNYWSEVQWRDAFKALDLDIKEWNGSLKLYPWPFDYCFGRTLQFITKVEKTSYMVTNIF